MSICSDIFISQVEARQMVEEQLMQNQMNLVKKAVKCMADWELENYLNDKSELYYYNIEKKKNDSRSR